jgi:D-alanyl-D-alanine carboxypeptidase (penicillin-binding protein 5/6)
VKRIAILLALAICASIPGAAHAVGNVPPVHARAFLVVDAATGETLASYRAHQRLPIASLTKLMTVLVTIEHHKLTDVVAVDPRAASVGESSIGVAPGELLTVRDLIEAALIQSANDAADALALSISPSFAAFARLMNAKAAELGLRDTHFVRPDGLDAPGEYSSAADVTTLARDLMRTRFVRETVRQRTATIGVGHALHTWNDLLGAFPNVIGVKTGHTGAAGWCQVAAVRARGVTIYSTILGGPSRSVRNSDLESLLGWGEAQFRIVPAVQTGRVYASVRLPYGKHDVGLVAARPLRLVARLARPLTERVVAAEAVSLPLRRGTVLGRVEIWAGTKLVGRRDLVSSRTVNRPGLGGRLGFYAGRTLHHLAHLL